jgi:hypothetical protein
MPWSRSPEGCVPTAALQAETPAATGTHEACRQVTGASAAGGARDCHRSDAIAAVMQVRPLSVVSGTAGSRPFGRLAFADSVWL